VRVLKMTAMFKAMVFRQDDSVRDNLGDDIVTNDIVRDFPDRQPASVPSMSLHAQLDALLYARWLPGRWVQRVWMLSDLPPCLEQRARSISSDAIWRAYTDGVRLWFAVAAAAVSSYGRSAVAMEVLFFENDGALCSGGLWRQWGLVPGTAH
jgi:hypothetical protein